MDEGNAGPSGRFVGTVAVDLTIPDGYMKHYVALPDDLARSFAVAGVDRVEGHIAGTAFRRSLHRRPDGSLCLRFGVTWLRTTGLELGEHVTVEIARDPDPDLVPVPAELAAQLDADPAVGHAWNSLSPGRRRTLVHGIERAMRPETRRRRADAIVADVREEFGIM